MIIRTTNTSWFSILMAIGTIWVLLIIVSSLAITYIRESKLSRFSYNEVLVGAAAEWAFEYGMLKVSNHRDWFEDIVSPIEPDGQLLDLSTPRSKWLQTEYNIEASSTDKIFPLSGADHLIIPLFVSSDGFITGGAFSKNPIYNTGVINTTNLNVSWIGWLSWSIVAMSGSQSIAITGVGDISPSTQWLIRIKTSQCYSWTGSNAWNTIDCSTLNSAKNDEEILYTYDETKTIADFLASKKDPYLIVYNNNTGNSSPVLVNISSRTAFSLPTVTLTARSNKAESSQIFQFTENKAAYYDALKYWIYNNQ